MILGRFPGHARKIMNAFWGLGQLMFSKTIIVVDKDVNVQDVREVAWILDDAAGLLAYGGKMCIALGQSPALDAFAQFRTRPVLSQCD